MNRRFFSVYSDPDFRYLLRIRIDIKALLNLLLQDLQINLLQIIVTCKVDYNLFIMRQYPLLLHFSYLGCYSPDTLIHFIIQPHVLRSPKNRDAAQEINGLVCHVDSILRIIRTSPGQVPVRINPIRLVFPVIIFHAEFKRYDAPIRSVFT